MQEIFETLYSGKHLNFLQMKKLADTIFDGELEDSQLSAALIAMKMNGASVDELAALAQVMQGNAIKVPDEPTKAMDNCGTGGDHSNSFNVSTTSAFVLAGGGITMAKHGNRSVSSRSGSADVLENLGVQINTTPEKISHLLNEVGIAFLFAQSFHPDMKYVMKTRRELATPTIFNLIGPIINPVQLETQLLGTYKGDSLVTTAKTLGQLGRKQAIVVHGFGGMDEANLAGTTKYAMLKDGKVEEFSFTPEEYGFTSAPMAAIVGGEAAKNAEILVGILKNKPLSQAHLDTVILNAGLGFYANGQVKTLAAGFDEARQSIASGAAYDKLQQLLNEQ